MASLQLTLACLLTATPFSYGLARDSTSWRQSESISPGAVVKHDAKPVLREDLQQAVWVSGFPRSGSSTMLSMVSAGGYARPSARTPGQIFSLFEPCHDGDVVDETLNAEGCRGLLQGISRCDFSRVSKLWGWHDPHTTNNHESYSKDKATRYCSSSDVVAFKTVDFGHNLAEHTDLLDGEPRLKVLSVVRDPRGIYASWKTTEPFRTLVEQGQFYTLPQICEAFAQNVELEHPNVFRVDFEQAMRDPHLAMRQVYEFLELPYGDAQEAWVNRTFDTEACPPVPTKLRGFTDCHEKSKVENDKWRHVLTADELDLFDSTPACQRVVQAYNYTA